MDDQWYLNNDLFDEVQSFLSYNQNPARLYQLEET
jgi:hypothetical protein